MKKAFFLFLSLSLVVMLSVNAGAENRNAKLIPVKPATNEAAASPSNLESRTVYEAQYAEPAPRDQLYVFWVLGKVISYPIDKVESYISKKISSLQQPKAVPALAPASSSSPFDSLNWREIPPAPPVQQKNSNSR